MLASWYLQFECGGFRVVEVVFWKCVDAPGISTFIVGHEPRRGTFELRDSVVERLLQFSQIRLESFLYHLPRSPANDFRRTPIAEVVREGQFQVKVFHHLGKAESSNLLPP